MSSYKLVVAIPNPSIIVCWCSPNNRFDKKRFVSSVFFITSYNTEAKTSCCISPQYNFFAAVQIPGRNYFINACISTEANLIVNVLLRMPLSFHTLAVYFEYTKNMRAPEMIFFGTLFLVVHCCFESLDFHEWSFQNHKYLPSIYFKMAKPYRT